jgi:hypothetical protein
MEAPGETNLTVIHQIQEGMDDSYSLGRQAESKCCKGKCKLHALEMSTGVPVFL